MTKYLSTWAYEKRLHSNCNFHLWPAEAQSHLTVQNAVSLTTKVHVVLTFSTLFKSPKLLVRLKAVSLLQASGKHKKMEEWDFHTSNIQWYRVNIAIPKDSNRKIRPKHRRPNTTKPNNSMSSIQYSWWQHPFNSVSSLGASCSPWKRIHVCSIINILKSSIQSRLSTQL